MARTKREAVVELTCIGECAGMDAPTWMVEGRFNAEGEFEPTEVEEMECPECNERGEPTNADEAVRVADV